MSATYPENTIKIVLVDSQKVTVVFAKHDGSRSGRMKHRSSSKYSIREAVIFIRGSTNRLKFEISIIKVYLLDDLHL